MKRVWIKVFLVIYVLILTLLFVRGMSSSYYSVAFNNEKTQAFNSGWMYDSAGKTQRIQLPAKLDIPSKTPVTIVNTVPDSTSDDRCLLIRATMQSVQVRCGDELVCQYPEDGLITHSAISPGSWWLIVGIPQKYNGLPISITYLSLLNQYAGSINPLLWGSRAALMYHIVRNYAFTLITAIVTLIASLVLFVVYLSTKNRFAYTSLLYLSLSFFSTGFWLLGEARMLQFFCGNYFIVTRLSYVFVTVIPIFIVLYFDSSYKAHHKNPSKLFLFSFIVNSVVSILLHLMGVVEIFKTVWITNSLIIVYFVYIASSMLYEIFRHNNSDARKTFLPSLVLLIAGLWEIVNLAFGAFSRVGFFLQIGFVVYMLIAGFLSMQNVVIYTRNFQEAQYYRRMAYTDLLTYGKNRTAYMEDLRHFTQNNLQTKQSLWLLVFDVNHLKYINETFGYEAGNDTIKHCYRCIVDSFDAPETVYRMAGDEFSCLLYDADHELVLRGCR